MRVCRIRGPRLLALALLAPALVTPAVRADEPFRLLTLDAGEITGDAVSLARDGSAIAVSGNGERRDVALEDLVRIRPRHDPAAAAGAEFDVEALLVDGSRLIGWLRAASDDFLALESPALGARAIPLDLVRAASFGPAAERASPADLRGEEDLDVLIRRGRLAGDRLGGTLVRVGADAVAIASESLGDVVLKPEEVLGIVVVAEAIEPEDESARRVTVDLVGGSTLLGELVALSDRGALLATVLGAADSPLEIPFDRIVEIRFGGSRFAFLSELEPDAVTQTPWIGGDDDFVFPWRRDRSVIGEPLRVGGVAYGKGLGMHSRTRLRFALDARYRSLRARFGLTDDAAALPVRGDVELVILVDSVERFRRAGIGPGPAIDIPAIDLAGGKQLEILCDFGAGGDVADRAALLDPILLRAD
jgi:hypothetical protein